MSNFAGISLRPDLGLRSLLPQWRGMLSPRWLKEDLLAGLAVACVALPLSMAIALASGVDPGVGLVSSIVGATVVALFGGTPLAVSGPAAAMAVLVAAIVQQFGLGGLMVVGFGCGLLQLATGVLGYGRFACFVPIPVIAGFTAGIGAIILIGQLPRALGLPPPDQSHILQVATHLRDFLDQTRPVSLLLSLSTVGLILMAPRFLPSIPAPLLGVGLPTLLVAVLGISTPLIGSIPDRLPMPHLPVLPAGGFGRLLWVTVIAYALASLETLLSSGAVDKLSKGARHDPDQELIGQGLGNLLTALFGGIPITGVIARSALNVQSGARTRRAALIHAAVVLGAVFLASGLMARIPVAVLAGVLLSVALRMLHPREFLVLWASSRSEAVIYLVTFVAIVALDLVVGIQAGIVAALAIAALRSGRSRARLATSASPGPAVVSLDGHLTFLATSRLDSVRADLEAMDLRHGVIFDLGGVLGMDASGGTRLVEILEGIARRGGRFVLKGLAPDTLRTLRSLDPSGSLADRCACSEADVMRHLGMDARASGLDRLLGGVERFRRDLGAGTRILFRSLAGGQAPHTLFITCSDSRIDPNLITSTEPGELFILRNIGNLVPAFGAGAASSEAAGIEFAVGVLEVREVVLCAHSGCGAMKALLSEDLLSAGNRDRFPGLSQWRERASGIRARFPPAVTPDEASRRNAILQLEHLKSHPLVRERMSLGRLRLHVWYYDIGRAELEAWDEVRGVFRRIGPGAVPLPVSCT